MAVSYTHLDVYKRQIPGCTVQVRPNILAGGNPNLIPEKAKQQSLGFVIAPTSNFNVSVDWWQIERINTIRSGFKLLDMAASYDAYKQSYIRDQNGTLIAIDQRAINSGGTLASGVELDANLMGEFAGGRWRVNLNGSYLDVFKIKDLSLIHI